MSMFIKDEWSPEGETEVMLILTHYMTPDKNLALTLTDARTFEPYAALTVNLHPLVPGFAYLDTNNMPQAEAFVERYGLGKKTGKTARSGFCEYPLYDFRELTEKPAEMGATAAPAP